MAARLLIVARAPGSGVAGEPDSVCVAESASGPAGLPALRAAECRRFEDTLIEHLGAGGCRLLIMPHVYYLQPDGAAVRRMKAFDGDLVVASWLPPRAAYWTLRALGVAGARAEEREPGARQAERTIRCLYMGGDALAPDCARSMLDGAEPASERGSVEDISAAVPPRWYPVLDYSRCKKCGQCLDFCLFGVYEREDEQVVATHPDRCKPGCPACARVCPVGAIMFPHYTDDPAIAGAPGRFVVGRTADVERFFRAGRPGQGGAPDAHGAADDGSARDEDLQDLMKALDEFDEA